MNKLGGMCFNWKVYAGLGVVGLGIWIVAPNLVIAALPLLLLLACPISMALMMRGMGGNQCAMQEAQTDRMEHANVTPDARLADLRAQREALTCEISELEAAQRSPDAGGDVGARPEQQAT